MLLLKENDSENVERVVKLMLFMERMKIIFHAKHSHTCLLYLSVENNKCYRFRNSAFLKIKKTGQRQGKKELIYKDCRSLC